jgi:hypothetical protein
MWKWAKPQEYRDKYDELPVRYKKIVRDVDIVVLVIAVGLLAYPYIAYRKGA